jgi:hypothetical protein
LDFLGFPWILSSESRLINGLRGMKREQFLSALSVPLAAPERWLGPWFVACGTAGLFMGELNQISDSLQ